MRKHFWISNAAFARMTGIKFVCMDCGLGVASKRDPEARAACPGVRMGADMERLREAAVTPKEL